MNYDQHDITTARVNPYDKYDEGAFETAENKAETVLNEIEERAEDDDHDCQETALQMLDKIKHVKFYGKTGGFTLCLEDDAEDFSLYLIHSERPDTVDFEKNHIRF